MDTNTATLVGVLIGSCFSVLSSFLSGWFLHHATTKQKRMENRREDMLVKRGKIEALALDEERLNRMLIDLEYDVLRRGTPTEDMDKYMKELTGDAYRIYAVVPLYFLELAPLVSQYNETLVHAVNALGRCNSILQTELVQRERVVQEYREINERRKKQYGLLRGQFRREMETIEQTLRKF